LLPQNFTVDRFRAGENNALDAFCPGDFQNVHCAVDTDLDSQSRVDLRGLRHQRRQVSDVSNFVIVDQFFQGLLIAHVRFNTVNLIFDIPHQRKIPTVVQQHRTQPLFNQQPGSHSPVNSHPTRNQHVHNKDLKDSFCPSIRFLA
jgi:hypothetical protein